MSFFGSNPKPKELIPEGKHVCVLFTAIELGDHESEYNGEMKTKHKIYLGWEVVGSKMSDGRPFMWGREFTVTKSKKGNYYVSKNASLYKILASLEPDADVFMADKLYEGAGIGVPCLMTFGHNEKEGTIYSNMISTNPYKGKEPVATVNQPIIYRLGAPGSEIPEAVFDWCKKKIATCKEWSGGAPAESEIPF